jgi:molybdenum cofactor cytidylyltransferase
MKFGPRNVRDAQGAILAHSVLAAKRRLRKGTVLGAADISDLEAAGIDQVTVAVLSPDDVHEDAAAEQLAKSLVPPGDTSSLRLSAPFTGRVNIYAEADGIVRIDRDAVNRFNRITDAITVATVHDLQRVTKRALIATVKIIPFATSQANVRDASAAAPGALRFQPFERRQVALIMTRTPGMKPSLLTKGAGAVAHRINGLGCELSEPVIVAHEPGALARALGAVKADLVLILTGSATSDEIDVGPAALVAAGGQLVRFGMPVDPGNLLFIGRLGEKTVVGLPGCARSPALNGADWVLERLISGISVSASDIAAMGVGGLLKEISTRPQSRGGVAKVPTRARTEVVLLAAGASTRMRGRDKLLEDIDGVPLLRHCAQVALDAGVDRVNVVLPPDNQPRLVALRGLDVNTVTCRDWQAGMSASLRAGLAAVSLDCDAVIIALADMPAVTADHLRRLVAAFDPPEGREICRATAADGTPGHPVLFGRRFFEALAGLTGDHGARDILREASEFLVEVPTRGQGATIDLDTPQDWAEWRLQHAAGLH